MNDEAARRAPDSMVRRTPSEGLRTWPRPDPAARETDPIPGGLEVDVLKQHADGWAHVRCSNGWEAWVDGRLLEDPRRAPTQPAAAAPTGGARQAWAVAGIVIAAAVIGVLAWTQLNGADDDPVAISATEPDAAQAQETAAPDTDSDTQETSDVTSDEDAAAEELAALFEFDASQVESAPPPTTPRELIGGPADRVAAAVLRQDLEQAGHDLTGLGIGVLPVHGTGGSLLVLSVDDSTALVASSSGDEETAVAEQLLLDVISTIRAQQLDITQVAFNYSGTDDQGPLVFTATFSVEGIEAAAAGQRQPEEVIKVQVTRDGGT